MHVTPFARNSWLAFWIFGKKFPGVSRTRTDFINLIQNNFTQRMGVPMQLSMLRRGWSLVTLTLSSYMCHWCQYRYLVHNLRFDRCWYAKISMTSRSRCCAQLLTTRMGSPPSKVLLFQESSMEPCWPTKRLDEGRAFSGYLCSVQMAG